MSENGEIYTAGKNFTLPPALTAWTNSTSENTVLVYESSSQFLKRQKNWYLLNLKFYESWQKFYSGGEKKGWFSTSPAVEYHYIAHFKIEYSETNI